MIDLPDPLDLSERDSSADEPMGGFIDLDALIAEAKRAPKGAKSAAPRATTAPPESEFFLTGYAAVVNEQACICGATERMLEGYFSIRAHRRTGSEIWRRAEPSTLLPNLPRGLRTRQTPVQHCLSCMWKEGFSHADPVPLESTLINLMKGTTDAKTEESSTAGTLPCSPPAGDSSGDTLADLLAPAPDGSEAGGIQ